MIFHGRCRAALGQVEEGLELLHEGLAAYRATNSMLYVPSFLTFLADAYGRARQPEKGLKYLVEAAEIVELSELAWMSSRCIGCGQTFCSPWAT